MTLHLLCAAPQADIYYDTSNNWLFIDWAGELTLDVVQGACLEIARCYQQYAYPRVLNSNVQVTSFAPDVAEWLASVFIPNLGAIGVEQVAWVVAPTLRGRNGALDTIQRLVSTHFNLFNNMADAVAWFQQTAPQPSPGEALLTHPIAQAAERTELINQLLAQHLPPPRLAA